METTLRLIETHGLTLVAIVLLVAWLRPKIDDMWTAIMKLASRPEPPLPQKEDSLSVKVERGKELAGKIK